MKANYGIIARGSSFDQGDLVLLFNPKVDSQMAKALQNCQENKLCGP